MDEEKVHFAEAKSDDGQQNTDDSEVTEPEVTDSEVTDPGVLTEEVSFEVTDAEVTEPGVTGSEVTDPEVLTEEVSFEVTDAEVTEPGGTDSEVTDPDVLTEEVSFEEADAVTEPGEKEDSFEVEDIQNKDVNTDKVVTFKETFSSESDLDSFLKNLETDCHLLKININKHCDMWRKVILSAHLKTDENKYTMIFLRKMIESMPVGVSKYCNWRNHVKLVYKLAKWGKISAEEKYTALLWFEKNIGVSYFHKNSYWSMIHNLEKDNVQKRLEFYKKQFSSPGISLDEPFGEFQEFAHNNDINKNDISEVEQLYDTNMNESDMLSKEFLGFFEHCFHHAKFERYVCSLLEEKPHLADTILALCEETVVDEQRAFCYHLILLKCFLSLKDVTQDDMQSQLFKILKRGIHLSDYYCKDTCFYFVDLALSSAASYLSKHQCKEIVKSVKEMQKKSDTKVMLSCRKALAFNMRTLLANGKLEVDLKDVSGFCFDETEYLQVHEINDILENELTCFELKLVLVLLERELLKTPWQNLFSRLEESLMDTLSTEVILKYTSFISTHGSPLEFELATAKALKVLSEFPMNTYQAQLILKARQREHIAIYGATESTKITVMDLICDMSHKSSIDLLVTDFDEGSEGTTIVTSENESMAEEIDKSTVDETDKSTVDLTEEPCKGFPVFLSNLNYSATDTDIINAFQNHGIEVVKVDLKMIPRSTSKNVGYATVFLKTVEQVNRALEDLDRIEILHREVFISEYKKKQTSSERKMTPEPTVLFVTGLPKRWANEVKIQELLAPYGHIKNIVISDDNLLTVEYHMAGDCIVGCEKLKIVLANTNALIRRGFPKRSPSQLKRKRANYPKEGKKQTKIIEVDLTIDDDSPPRITKCKKLRKSSSPKTTETKVNIPNQRNGNQDSLIDMTKDSPPKERLERLNSSPHSSGRFNARLQMRQKLDVSSGRTPRTDAPEEILSESSDDSVQEIDCPTEEKRQRPNENEEDRKNLTNADFKKMFEK